jgi:hypothetical protein
VVSITPRPRFTPGERTPGTDFTGGWVGLKAGLDTEARGKILCPCRGSNPDRPVVQPVVRHYTDWANPAPNIKVNFTPFSSCMNIKFIHEENGVKLTKMDLKRDLEVWCIVVSHVMTCSRSDVFVPSCTRWQPKKSYSSFLQHPQPSLRYKSWRRGFFLAKKPCFSAKFRNWVQSRDCYTYYVERWISFKIKKIKINQSLLTIGSENKFCNY